MKVIVLCILVIYVAYASTEKCSLKCTRIYKPVCGGPKGGPYATFSNDCVYKYANCEHGYSFEIFSQGVCREECSQACTFDYNPVCAGPKGGPWTTYPNECAFEVENCEGKFNEFVAYTGECKPLD